MIYQELHGIPEGCKNNYAAFRMRCQLFPHKTQGDLRLGMEFLCPHQRSVKKFPEGWIFYQPLACLAATRTCSLSYQFCKITFQYFASLGLGKGNCVPDLHARGIY